MKSNFIVSANQESSLLITAELYFRPDFILLYFLEASPEQLVIFSMYNSMQESNDLISQLYFSIYNIYMDDIDSLFQPNSQNIQLFKQNYSDDHLCLIIKDSQLDSIIQRVCTPTFNDQDILAEYSSRDYQRRPQDERNTTNDEGGGQRRANNTIFKTSLGQFRKSIVDVVKKPSSSLNFLKREIKEVYKTKNQSVFPKLLSMVRALRIQNEVFQCWNLRKEKLIERKTLALANGKFAQKRLTELKKTISIMDQSLQTTNIQQSLNLYWGKHRQHQKYEKCRNQVIEFESEFIKCYQDISADKKEKSTKMEAQNGSKGSIMRQNKNESNTQSVVYD